MIKNIKRPDDKKNQDNFQPTPLTVKPFIQLEPEQRQPGRLICKIINVLKYMGVLIEHLPHALQIIITMISAKAGDPLAVCVTEDDNVAAVTLVNDCMQLVPKSSFVEFLNMDQKTLFYAGDKYKGRVLISLNEKGFIKNIDNLMLLVTRSLVVDQQSYKAKNSRGTEELKIEGPVAWITVLHNKIDVFLSNPYVLRLHLNINGDMIKKKLLTNVQLKNVNTKNKVSIESKVIAKQLFNLTAADVEIPFLEQIIDALDFDGRTEARYEQICREIRIITRLNVLEPLRSDVLIAEALELDVEQFKNDGYMSAQNILPLNNGHQAEDVIKGTNPLIATKVDYYYFYFLREFFLCGGDGSLTDRQKVILSVILKSNLDYIRGMTGLDPEKSSEEEILDAIHYGEGLKGWVSKLSIQKGFNDVCDDHGLEKIKGGTLNIELQRMIDKKVVLKKKDQKRPNKYLYAVVNTTIDISKKLPSPDEIIDPVYKGKPVEVINPFTGGLETI